MKMKIVSSALALSFANVCVHADDLGGKTTWLGDVVGRDLDSRIAGVLGHVGVATGPAWSGKDMPKQADRVIEVLNHPDAVTFTDLRDFVYLTKYWGSKYGVATYDQRGYVMLREANWQSWWQADYVFSTRFKPGEGIPTTGQKISRGQFRCDTFVWWVYNNAGWDLRVTSMTPAGVYTRLPSFNARPWLLPESQTSQPPLAEVHTDKKLTDLTVEDVNELPIEELQMIVDAPPVDSVSIAAPQIELAFALDPKVDPLKRYFFLDDITATDNQPGIVDTLIHLNRDDQSEEMRGIAANRLMHYYETYVRGKTKPDDLVKIKQFFADFLNAGRYTEREADAAASVFIDAFSPDEVMANLDRIDAALRVVTQKHAIQHRYSLMFKSPTLQARYMQAIVDQLVSAGDSDLDSFLFGPLSIGLENSGKTLLLPETQDILRGFLRLRAERYADEHLLDDKKDFFRLTTAPLYKQVRDIIGME